MVHLARPEKFQPVVRDLKIEFKAPAFSSVTAEAQFSQAQADEMNDTLDKKGRFDFTLVADLKDENEKLVARRPPITSSEFSGRLMRRNQREV